MNDCERVRELLPWYARRSLPQEESQIVAEHLAVCDDCRSELADDIRLSMEIEQGLRAEAGLPKSAWTRVAERTHGTSVTKVDVGSFLLGFSVAAKMKLGKFPIRGDLRLLGRNIRLFDMGKES